MVNDAPNLARSRDREASDQLVLGRLLRPVEVVNDNDVADEPAEAHKHDVLR